MTNFTCTDNDGTCIYPQEVRSCCLICGMRKPFDPTDYSDPWPSWNGIKTGDEIEISFAGGPERHPATVLSTHRGGARVEVNAAGFEPWIQFVMQKCRDGVYAR